MSGEKDVRNCNKTVFGGKKAFSVKQNFLEHPNMDESEGVFQNTFISTKKKGHDHNFLSVVIVNNNEYLVSICLYFRGRGPLCGALLLTISVMHRVCVFFTSLWSIGGIICSAKLLMIVKPEYAGSSKATPHKMPLNLTQTEMQYVDNLFFARQFPFR